VIAFTIHVESDRDLWHAGVPEYNLSAKGHSPAEAASNVAALAMREIESRAPRPTSADLLRPVNATVAARYPGVG
jgi:hypothetical protein